MRIPRKKVQFQGKSFDIEVEDITTQGKRLECYARAWENGKQVGFGSKGDVDLERFIVINPPTLVKDPAGTIVKTWTDDFTGEVREQRYRNDPDHALLEALNHTISVKKEKADGKRIKQGKRGSTTTTVFPDPDPETSTVDGYVGRQANETWNTTVTSTAGTTASDSSGAAGVRATASNSAGGGGNENQINRGIILFDTSAVGSDTISSATLSLEPDNVFDDDNDANGYTVIVSSAPASDTALATGDYDSLGSTELSDQINSTDASTGAYEVYTLNASGISNIDGNGISKFGVREGHDLNNDEPSVSGDSGLTYKAAETSLTTSDPKLVVEHTAAATRRIFIVT